jgi:hypothetical protein
MSLRMFIAHGDDISFLPHYTSQRRGMRCTLSHPPGTAIFAGRKSAKSLPGDNRGKRTMTKLSYNEVLTRTVEELPPSTPFLMPAVS